MTKKHLITCSVIIVLVIISTLNIYSAMGSKTAVEPAVKPVINVPALALKTVNFVPKSIAAENDFSFANEALPLNDARVKHKLQRSLAKHYFKNVGTNILQTKALQLFPIIEPILKAYGIPEDFKYIPLVESGLCEGTSPRGAKGIWQFMPGTARTYGLKVRDGVDERMNTRKSTIAACKYIKELYVEFNSWTLAAAAYNNGEIQIERAINRQNEDNYFLMHLNGETAAYVYNIIAMKQIISQPGKYGYKTYLKPNELFAYN
ncbi:lytic transglycosylase domain-containing protein [Mucilaginibacter sp.]|uniref:lytic transglycosylase domain-containing protein n=1 Tax=Mucilaginibacter sp. TaxID=1882438 RepID=UPI00284DCF1C|nr:lytic transglycosylase domain-containing protein [Mucilaginibacter sp.]MDR3696265.1 lytic transglycosylase domain-containing protein [Mucilaginibacter sp.]